MNHVVVFVGMNIHTVLPHHINFNCILYNNYAAVKILPRDTFIPVVINRSYDGVVGVNTDPCCYIGFACNDIFCENHALFEILWSGIFVSVHQEIM
jgi:hypothetical protein